MNVHGKTGHSVPDPGTRLPQVETTIFAVMSALAAEHRAINLSQGFPDFDCPAALREAVARHMAAGRNQYAPMGGVPALCAAIADKVRRCYGRVIDPAREVTVTAGATEGLFCAITALVRPGDEVVLFDPVYDAYEPAVTLAGGRARHLPLQPPDYHIDWQRLADALSPRTRLVMINTPHNPTGAVIPGDGLKQFAELLRSTDAYIVADEVYEHIVFDGRPHASLHTHPELVARTVVVSSFGKSCHATGWKVGYCVAPPRLTEELRKVHQYVTFSVATPLQYAYADFLAAEPEFDVTLAGFYQAKRDLFCGLLGDSRFAVTPAAGTYFQLADYSAISDEPDVDFARRLTRDHGVAAIPLSPFSAAPDPQQRVVRFCFAKSDHTLREAAARLCAI